MKGGLRERRAARKKYNVLEAASGHMSGIFICYRRDDSAPYAGRLYDWLSNQFGAERVFIDVDNIPLGADFTQLIAERVGNCDALVCLIGNHWITCVDEHGKQRLDQPDDFVRLELLTALERNIPVIPVLVDEGRMPRIQELPEVLAKIARLNALELGHARFRHDVDVLLRLLQTTLARVEREKNALETSLIADAEPLTAEQERADRERIDAKALQRTTLFSIIPVQEVIVQPAVPELLQRLPELSMNLFWSWNHSLRVLFHRLDPALWKSCNHNPVLMLSRMAQGDFEKAASDPTFLSLYRRSCDIYDAYLNSTQSDNSFLVAYFSMEYGLIDCMPIYSGGLGVLSGDYLKASSDAMLPLVAVGLLYRSGYLQQRLSRDGWQEESAVDNDFYSLPITPVMGPDGSAMHVDVPLAGSTIFAKIWRANVGRVSLLLLDTDIPENPNAIHRSITSQLYGGDAIKRISQEIVLGIGGVRALLQMGFSPTVYHMNEGHSAFLALERICALMLAEKLGFEESLDAIRRNNVFTTHTAGPAGSDVFDHTLINEYLGTYCAQSGIKIEQLLALGRFHVEDRTEPFKMAVAALQTSSYRNAVSRLHRSISQEMWQLLWPTLPSWEVPISSVTNGVHVESWINEDLAALYDQYLPPDWRQGEGWPQIAKIPLTELWQARRKRKRKMVVAIREWTVRTALTRNAMASEVRRLQSVLNADALMIGFAQRFTAYKRPTLLFRNLERLRNVLTNPDRPVQVIIAGKAHPKDLPAKALIREVWHSSKYKELADHIFFVEDYSLEVAHELVSGVDVWLNTSRRGEEACGTSGMKAGVNGVLNLSVLDGWFDEAYEEVGGWAIGGRQLYKEEEDEADASEIYSLLENEIVPLYFEKREQGAPTEWTRLVRKSLQAMSSLCNSRRMIAEYDEQLYRPAHVGYQEARKTGFAMQRANVEWARNVVSCWQGVRAVELSPISAGAISTTTSIPLRIAVDLAGLKAKDVRVEAIVGRVDGNGRLADAEVVLLNPLEERGSVVAFGRDFVPTITGRLGFSFRISPNDCEDPRTRSCHTLMKWVWM